MDAHVDAILSILSGWIITVRSRNNPVIVFLFGRHATDCKQLGSAIRAFSWLDEDSLSRNFLEQHNCWYLLRPQ